MLFCIHPVTDISVPPRVRQSSLAVDLTAIIWKAEPDAAHAVVLPLPLVTFSILILQYTIAAEEGALAGSAEHSHIPLFHVIGPLSFVDIAVGEQEGSFAFHLAVHPITLIYAAVSVQILASAVHLALRLRLAQTNRENFTVVPVSFILFHHLPFGSYVRDGTAAVAPIVLPVASIDVAFRIPIGAAPVHLAL